jgi:hypothetical protein
LQLRKVYLKGAAALAAVAALLAIATVLQGDFGETGGKIFPTIAATFVAGGGISVVAVRMAGKRVVRIGDDEAPLAADESVLPRRS